MNKSTVQILASICLLPVAAQMVSAQSNPALLPHDEVSNWGRWGEGDERGAVNYMTPEAIVDAAKLITKGKTFSLAIPIDASGPRIPSRRPPHHFMVSSGIDVTASANPNSSAVRFTDDYIYMPLQGSTQWDGLPHAFYGGSFYNGFPLDSIRTTGAQRLGLENVKDSFVGRGVLIDIVRYKGGTLATGYGITRSDIEGALDEQGVQVHEGDIVILRTGEVPAYYRMNAGARAQWHLRQTGIVKDVIPWISEMKIAAIAADNLAIERSPNPDRRNYNLHGNILRDMGVYIGELWTVEELAADCAEDGRYEFFICAPPLHIPGAVGSPLNPIAIK